MLQCVGIGADTGQRVVIFLGVCQIEQFAGVAQIAIEQLQRRDQVLQRLAFPAEFL